ncbi:hypothetical protein HNR19_002609 [Nocardioides thalensis]|uniref:Uncharacterized protein n=1 Tax=Nocardioides thalensis TaxID=1914755 RepID=A0A853C434_9ACTN|nr:hypothetical protein [Nocardioides thalensis]NYJ01911.1 hypothetical protein [Nocardioides thalensis]
MGAKDWFVCYADGDVSSLLATRPEIDRAATEALIRRLFAGHTVVSAADGTLAEHASPDDDMVYAAVWPRMTIVCTSAVALDRPSDIDARFLAEGADRTVYVHAMHSVVDWFALGVWGPGGQLRRSLSLSGGNEELIEDVGEHLSFEQPFWAGEYPAIEDEEDEEYPFPFHPLELAEAALDNLFGFVFEGYEDMPDDDSADPFDITLAGFRLTAEARKRRLFGRG